jgi:hypothetical protein
MTKDVWLTQTNKINNSATNLKAYVTEFNKMYTEAVESQQAGTFDPNDPKNMLSARNSIDAMNMDNLGAVAQFKNHTFKWTDSGDLLMVKLKKNAKTGKMEPSMQLGDYKTVPSSMAAVVQKYKTVDMEKRYDDIAANVKPIIEVIGKGKISTREDAFSNDDVKKYINDNLEAIYNDEDAFQSVLDNMGVSADNGKPYIPTQDIKAALADESRLLMHMNQDGRLEFVDPDNKDLWDEYIKNGATQAEVDQVKGNLEKARNKTKANLENGISARLKFEEKFDKPPAPKAFNKAEFDYKKGLQQATSVGREIGKFYDGNATSINNAGEVLAKQNIKLDDKTNIKVSSLKREPSNSDADLAVRLNYTIFTRDEQGKVTPENKSEVIEIKRDGEVLLSKHGFTDALFTTFYGRPPTSDERRQMADVYGQADTQTPTYSPFERETKTVKGGSYNDVNVIGAEKQGTKMLPHFLIKQEKHWKFEDGTDTEEIFDGYMSDYLLGLNGAIDASVDFDEFKYIDDEDINEGIIEFNYNGKKYSYTFKKGEEAPPYDKIKRAFEAIANNRPL